jgi:hypothetical protein
MQGMQQDLLANGNYAQYLAQALTPPNPGAGMIGGYGGAQGIGGQIGQGVPGQATSGMIPGVGGQPGYGYPAVGQPFAAQLPFAAHQQHIAGTLHQLAHQAVAQAVLGQQIAAVLNQLAHQCAWQAQTPWQNRPVGFGQQFGFGPQAAYGQPFGYGQASGMPFGQTFGQTSGSNRPVW